MRKDAVSEISPQSTEVHPLDLILAALKCTQKELAVRLGMTPAAISRWRYNRHGIPEEHVIPLWTMSGVEPYVIRPDRWPRSVPLPAMHLRA